MKLFVDGLQFEPRPGQSLLEIIREMGLDSRMLSRRPLAAKIAGEVFTLNYIPVRQQELSSDRASIRRAMAASNGQIHLLRYGDHNGRDTYVRTAQFVIFLAVRQLWPKAVAKMNCTVGSGLYISVTNAEGFSAAAVKQRIARLVEEDIPLLRRRVSVRDAVAYYEADGQQDKAELLRWRVADYFDEYVYEDYADYFYGEMMPSTGYLQSWDVAPAKGGFMFIYPDGQNPDRVAEYRDSPNFFQVFTEGEEWGRLMECSTVADLNGLGLPE